jgi:hypothetical protein
MFWNKLFKLNDTTQDDNYEIIDKNDVRLQTISWYLSKYFKKHNEINKFLKLYYNSQIGDYPYKEKTEDLETFLQTFLDLHNDNSYDKDKFIKLIHFIVDKNNGLGWRQLFKIIIKFLLENNVNINYEQILHKLITISRYDTMLVFMDTKYESLMYDVFCDILVSDKLNGDNISTLAYWIHNEKNDVNKKYNFNYNLSYLISKKLPNLYIQAVEENRFRINKSIYLKILRKDFLVPLKKIILENKHNRDFSFDSPNVTYDEDKRNKIENLKKYIDS